VRGTNHEAPNYAIFPAACYLFLGPNTYYSITEAPRRTSIHSYDHDNSRLAPQLVDATLISASWYVCPLCFCFRELSAMLYTAVYLDIWRVVHLTSLLSGQL